MATYVYLVPGFFGFTSLGAFNYFYRVRETLQAAFERRGQAPVIVECETQPTGSIRHRAVRVLERVIETGGLEADKIAFVGHSTGGLDIRLLATPGVKLRPDDAEERLARLTRSVVTVATPHFGTPLANFFTTLPGRQLLEMLTVLATTTGGRYSLFGAMQALKWVARLDDFAGRRDTFLDGLVERLFRKVSVTKDDPMWAFLRRVSSDQGAIIQLTPESMHLFNAAVVDHPDVRYASLITAAPPPPGHYRAGDLRSLVRLSMAGAFALMHTMAGREHRHYPYPYRGDDALADVELPFDVDRRTNDGVVPTLSQIHGRVLDVVQGDHLDVVGQFRWAGGSALSDWLPSGSRYDEERFLSTWDRIAEEISDACQAPARAD